MRTVALSFRHGAPVLQFAPVSWATFPGSIATPVVCSAAASGAYPLTGPSIPLPSVWCGRLAEAEWFSVRLLFPGLFCLLVKSRLVFDVSCQDLSYIPVVQPYGFTFRQVCLELPGWW